MPGVLGSRAQLAACMMPKAILAGVAWPLGYGPCPAPHKRASGQRSTDRIEEDLFCEIEGEQQALYRAELKRAQQLLLHIKTQKELASQQFHFLTSLLRLRQICCDPHLLKPDCTERGAKTEALLDVLDPLMEEGQKVLVFFSVCGDA